MKEIAEQIVNVFESAIEAEREKLKRCCSSDITQEDARKHYLGEVLESLEKNGFNKNQIIKIFRWAVYLEAAQRVGFSEKRSRYGRIHECRDALISSYSEALDSLLDNIRN